MDIHGYPWDLRSLRLSVLRSACDIVTSWVMSHFTRDLGAPQVMKIVHPSARTESENQNLHTPAKKHAVYQFIMVSHHGFSSWSKATNWVRMSIHHKFSHSNLHFKLPSLDDFPLYKIIKIYKKHLKSTAEAWCSDSTTKALMFGSFDSRPPRLRRALQGDSWPQIAVINVHWLQGIPSII